MSSMNCDLCGKEAEMYKALVEGTELTVCRACSQYGEGVRKIKTAEVKKPQEKVKTELLDTLVDNFGALLKSKREELGLNHKDFARKIAEKESILHKLETGAIRLTIEKARRLEKMLGLKLVEQEEDEPVTQQKGRGELTLGDMVKIKTRKGK